MSTKDIVYIALFASMIAAIGVVPPVMLPLSPVPITSQSLGVMLCGSILGAKRGLLASILFLTLVAIGFPVLAGGRGGIGALLGPSGGFLFCWPLTAYIIGLFFEKNWTILNYLRAFIYIFFGGIIVLYAVGIIWLSTVSGIQLDKAFYSVIVFIPGDIFKAIIATIISLITKRVYPLISAKAS